MDAFSQILSGVVLKGALFFNAEFSAPWGFNAPPAQELTRGWLLMHRTCWSIIF
jgi:hypothetical protein